MTLVTGLAGCEISLSALLYDESDLEAMAREVLELTNAERAKEAELIEKDLPPLIWNDELAEAGGVHCQDMIDRDYFAHNTPEGATPGDRATAAGYQWMWIGENIAAGYPTAEQVVEGWMNSPDHRENILRPQFTELGISVRFAANGRAYWAQEFGTPLPGD
jgi:uncharacterized protein YkwD